MSSPLFGVTLFNLLTVWPLWRILRRAGLEPRWSLVVFLPLIGFAAVLGKLAHSRWPTLPGKVTLARKQRRSV